MARVNDHTSMWDIILVMEVSGALRNQKVCVTGHVGIPRKQLHDIIKTAGGQVQDNVDWSTSILVSSGDWTALKMPKGKKSTKLAKAEELNRGPGSPRIRILSEAEFCDLIIRNGKTSSLDDA